MPKYDSKYKKDWEKHKDDSGLQIGVWTRKIKNKGCQKLTNFDKDIFKKKIITQNFFVVETSNFDFRNLQIKTYQKM